MAKILTQGEINFQTGLATLHDAQKALIALDGDLSIPSQHRETLFQIRVNIAVGIKLLTLVAGRQEEIKNGILEDQIAQENKRPDSE